MKALVGIPLAALLATSCPIIPPGPRPSPQPSVSPSNAPEPSPQPSASPSTVPTPTPFATPATCPALNRWGSTMYAARDSQFNSIPRSVWESSCRGGGSTGQPQHCVIPNAAGITIDSTPHFQGGGRACNGSHPPEDEPCGGRICEDPRGGDWVWDGANCRVEESGYQLVCNKLQAGMSIYWQVCPRSDLVDHAGKPVNTIGNPCTQGSVDIN